VALLKPAADNVLTSFEISPEINRGTSDGPQLQAPGGD